MKAVARGFLSLFALGLLVGWYWGCVALFQEGLWVHPKLPSWGKGFMALACIGGLLPVAVAANEWTKDDEEAR